MGDNRESLIKEVPCSNLDLNDCFFDSLRDNYGSEFDRWFKEKCVDGRRNALVIREGGSLYGLCVFKVEHNEPINSDGDIPCEIALKICTFKVSSEARGVKFGERLLRSVFEKCYSEAIPFIYLTTGSIQESLIKLLEEFGFHQYGIIKSRGAKTADCVFGKWITPHQGNQILDKDMFAREHFPSYKDDSTVGKFLVPIQPEWHEKLFPDLSNFRHSLFGQTLQFQASEGNAIRKAYVCKSSINRIMPGDLLFFYRSRDRHSVEAYGVVRTCARTKDFCTVQKLIKGRTVYTESDLRALIREADHGLLVISFDLLGYIHPSINVNDMKRYGIAIPQSIVRIGESAYMNIFRQKQLWQQY